MDIINNFDDWVNEQIKEIEEMTELANLNGISAFLDKAEVKIKKIFKECISDFYSDYTPIENNPSWSRTESMYNMLIVNRVTSEDGLPGLDMDFDPGKMSTFRDGAATKEGLYRQVFHFGWHGGAISSKSTERGPGLPTWRYPVTDGSAPRFTYEMPAEIADTPPYDNFVNKLREYWEGGPASSELKNCVKEALKNVGLGGE